MLIKVLVSLDIIHSNARICIYGTDREGYTFKKLMERVRPDVDIVCFIDLFRTGQIEGKNIITPEIEKDINDSYDMIVIASQSWQDICNMLDCLGVNNYMVASQHLCNMAISEYFGKEAKIQYWQLQTGIFSSDELKEYSGLIEQVRSMFESDNDRILFDVLIDNRRGVTNADVTLRHYIDNFMDINQQYLEFINRRTIRTVIDGGVADGNTTYNIYNHLIQGSMIYGFEPDYNIYLNGHFKKRLDSIPNIRIMPYALWRNRTTLQLMTGSDHSAGMIVNSAESGNSCISVNAISIDRFMRDYELNNVDMIKLDVEGSEMDVLEGARDTISVCRPQLAVSIYHKKEHLFQIPLLISNMVEDYVYRLGSYAPSHGEKILYAIPKEKYIG